MKTMQKVARAVSFQIVSPMQLVRQQRDRMLRGFAMWRDAQLGHLTAWLLSKRPVQRAVANAFSGATPMCNVLSHAIERAFDDESREVDADNVSGLGRYIEDAVGELDASSLKNMEEVVREAIDLEELVKEVLAEMADRLRG